MYASYKGISTPSDELTELKKEFQKIKWEVCDKVEQICVDPRDLVKKIMDLPAPLRDESDKEFLTENSSKIRKSKETCNVFDCIGFHWDYLNPDVYEHLIKEYSLDHLIKPFEEYRVKLDIFSDNISLLEFCNLDHPKDSPPPPPGFVKHRTKHDWNPKNTSLKKAFEYQKKSASEYGVRQCAVWLAEVGIGCVSITLLVPENTIPIIETKTPDFFQAHGITRVELNDRCLYDQEQVKKCHIHVYTCMYMLCLPDVIHLTALWN